jgi:hypothetical protein
LESWFVLLWYISTKILSACFFLSKYASAPRESLKVKKISEPVSIDRQYMMFFSRYNTVQAYVVNKPPQWHFVFRTFSF